MSTLLRPTWAEIDLGAIANNVGLVKRIAGPRVEVMAVVKAEAYGHGAIEVARAALKAGAASLGVAALGEAIALRQAGLTAPILVLGWTPGWLARDAVANDITCALFDLDTAGAFSRAAQELGRQLRAHIKIDSGMGRLGIPASDALPVVRDITSMNGLIVEGIFTHFSTADSRDKTYTRSQLEQFQSLLSALDSANIHIPVKHAANSAAIISLPESHFDQVRLGLAMYGLHPSADVRLPADFRPVMTLKTMVAQVKTLPPGHPVSYGNTYVTRDYERIAALPIGYADGFRRAPNHWGEVLVRGQRAPIVGRVCMDQTLINVTHISGVAQGDEVVLIGAQQGVQGNDWIRAEDVAARLGTINYEVTSMVMARVPRI